MDDQRYLLIFTIVFALGLRFLITFTQQVLRFVKPTRLESLEEVDEERVTKVLNIVSNKNRLFLSLAPTKTLLTIIMTAATFLFFQKDFIWWILIIVWAVVIIISEILPRTIALSNPTTMSLKYVGLFQFVIGLLSPINLLFTLINTLFSYFIKSKETSIFNEQDLLDIVEKAQNEGSIEEEEGDLIRRSIAFNDLDVYSILTPRVDVVAINIEWDDQRKREVIEESEYSRIPVYRDSIDTIIGVIHAKDFHKIVDDHVPFESILKPVLFTPTYFEVAKLLKQFQISKQHMAVVVDEHGGTAGIVTLEDILEELVGEIWDEHDDIEVDFQAINSYQYLVSANTDLDDFFNKFSLTVDEDEYDFSSVGGWVLDEMNKIPTVGEKFTFEHLTITIMEADDRRLYRIMVTIEQPKQDEEN